MGSLLGTKQLTCNHEPQSARRRVWLTVQRFRIGPYDLGLPNSPSPIEKLIPYPSVLALTDRTWALQNRMPLIPKGKENPENRPRIPNNLFIFNNMAEDTVTCELVSGAKSL